MTELQQTRNSFKVIGRATRLDKDGAYREDTASKGKREGQTYRSLRFGIKTSDTNEITVSMFDYEPEQVFLWNSEKKKKDSRYKGDRVPFGEWEQRKDQLKAEGYSVLQTRIGLVTGEDGKIVSEGLPGYVASEFIYDNLRNGDSVVVEGEIRYSRYKNQQGDMVEQKSYIIKKIFKLYEELDFGAEGFEEVTYFEQELVFVEADVAESEGKVYVTGRTIDFMKNFHDTQFVVNYKNPDGSNDPGMVKLAGAFKNILKFGDVLKVFGETSNRVVLRSVEAHEDEDVDLFAEFGGKKKPKHAQAYTARDYIQEMAIEGIEEHDAGVYTEADFVTDDLLEDKAPAGSLDFGGKEKKKGDNPFEGSSPIEISDDDLPF